MKGQFLVFGIAMAFLCAMVGIAAAATVTQNITYQGVLTNTGGTPLTGTYSITFKLYDASSGGTLLGTSVQTVQVSDGRFTTPVTFDSSFFDGQALWLGIMVGADPEMTPRQEIRPVPYASSLRPGAIIQDALFTTNQVGTGYGQPNPAVNISTHNSWNPGILINTTGPSSYGVWIRSNAPYNVGMYALTYGDHSDPVQGYVFGTNSSGIMGFSTSGKGIYGESAQHVGVYGKGKEGGYFTTNQGGSSDLNTSPGVNISTGYNYNPGMKVNTSGDNSHGVFAWTWGHYSHGVFAWTNGSQSYGVEAVTRGSSSTGVIAITYGKFSKGVHAATDGDYSDGVYAATRGADSNGVNAWTIGTNSNGVYALTDGDYSDGVHALTDGDYSQGVYAYTNGVFSDGVNASTIGTNSHGVYAETLGDYSDGVNVSTSGDHSHGVSAKTYGVFSNGVSAYSDTAYGIYADTGNSNTYGIYTPDRLWAWGGVFPTADVAEFMPVADNVTPGTVLVIGDDGKLEVTSTLYDTRVAGIVSTAPGISLGAKESGNEGEQNIAIAGRVPCKVDASSGAIHPGDLLTTSNNPGYAMKAEPTMINGRGFYPDGTILGKALGTLEAGTGVIEVLVTLQ